MSWIKEFLNEVDFAEFEQDMRTLADLKLEYTEDELTELFEKFGVKD